MDRRLASLRIPQADRESLVRLANFPAESTELLLAALASVRSPLSEPELRKHLQQHIPTIPSTDLHRVVDVLLVLLSVRANAAGTPVNLPELIASNDQLKLSDEGRAHLQQLLSRLLSLEPLILAWKAFDVLSEHERTYHSARTITEIRPLFSDTATERPKAAVIVHTLRITYHSDTGELKEFFVGLDNTDLEELAHALGRAKEKATTLNDLLKEMDLPTIEPTTE